jgi:hypothetical protein
MNTASGNADARTSYDPPNREQTRIGMQLLNAGDVIVVDQFTFGTAKSYTVDLFLILLEPQG